MRISKQKAIEIILVELLKGSTYSACLAAIGRKWTISETSFKRYWKEANKTHQERQQAIKEEVERELVEKAKKEQNEAILTREQRQVIASDIARGKAWKVGSSVMIPTAGDRLKALDYLSRIDGDFAPVKEEHKVSMDFATFLMEFNTVEDGASSG